MAYIVPPPRRRASPSYKTKGGVCSLHSLRSVVASVVPVTNPSLNASKEEGQPIARGYGLEGRKKRKHRVCIFSNTVGVHASPPLTHHSGAYFAHPGFSSSIRLSVVSPTASTVIHSCEALFPIHFRNSVAATFSRSNRRTACSLRKPQTGGLGVVVKHYEELRPPERPALPAGRRTFCREGITPKDPAA